MSLILLSGPSFLGVGTSTSGAPSPAVSNATSSALGLADLALVWGISAANLVLIDNDLATDRGLTTAVLLSIMLDRRAKDDDVPPSGDPTDRRGWWADQFLDNQGDRYGSRLWLLDRSKLTAETARLAEEYLREALQWMLDDRVVASIDITTDITSRRAALLMGAALQQPGRDAVAFQFAHVWDSVAA